jgi:hypothetical protein
MSGDASTDVNPEAAHDMHNTMRLVQMAVAKVRAAAEALFDAG